MTKSISKKILSSTEIMKESPGLERPISFQVTSVLAVPDTESGLKVAETFHSLGIVSPAIDISPNMTNSVEPDSGIGQGIPGVSLTAKITLFPSPLLLRTYPSRFGLSLLSVETSMIMLDSSSIDPSPLKIISPVTPDVLAMAVIGSGNHVSVSPIL